MIIIVEGIDRVGKTTLCEKLSEVTGIQIFKHNTKFDYSKMDNENETDKMIQLIELCKLTGSYVIFDRFHLSDYVYGTENRNYQCYKAMDNFKEIEKHMQGMDVVLLLMQPTDLEESSRQHGSSLNRHFGKMNSMFYESSIRIKLFCSYSCIDDIVNFVKLHEWEICE